MRYLFLLISSIFMFSCSSQTKQDDYKVILLSLYPNVVYGSLNRPQLSISELIEYSSSKDSLIYAKCNNYGYWGVSDSVDIPLFGLDSYYSIKSTILLKEQFDNISKLALDSTYSKHDGTEYIDDRHLEILFLEKNQEIQITIFKNGDLPEEAQMNINQIRETLKLLNATKTTRQISDETILNLQKKILSDSPPPPFKKTVQFIPPSIEVN